MNGYKSPFRVSFLDPNENQSALQAALNASFNQKDSLQGLKNKFIDETSESPPTDTPNPNDILSILSKSLAQGTATPPRVSPSLPSDILSIINPQAKSSMMQNNSPMGQFQASLNNQYNPDAGQPSVLDIKKGLMDMVPLAPVDSTTTQNDPNKNSILPFIKNQIDSMSTPSKAPNTEIQDAVKSINSSKDFMELLGNIIKGLGSTANTPEMQSIMGALASGGNPYTQRAFAEASDARRADQDKRQLQWNTSEESRKQRVNDLTKEYAKEQADQAKYQEELQKKSYENNLERQRKVQELEDKLKSEKELKDAQLKAQKESKDAELKASKEWKDAQIQMQRDSAKMHDDTLRFLGGLQASAKTDAQKEKLMEKINDHKEALNKVDAMADNLATSIDAGIEGPLGSLSNRVTSNSPLLKSDKQAAFESDRNFLVDSITKELVGRSSVPSIELMKAAVPSQKDTISQRKIKMARLKNLIKTEKDAIDKTYFSGGPTQSTGASSPALTPPSTGKVYTFNPKTGKTELQ